MNKFEKGFTLIEIVIGMALLSTAMIIGVLSFSSISRLQQHNISQRSVQQNSRYVLEDLDRDIRNATTITPCSTNPNCNSISMTTPLETGTINYTYDSDPTHKTYQSIIRTVNGVSTSVSGSGMRVTGIQYDYETVNSKPYVKISIQVAQENPNIISPSDPYYYNYAIDTIVTPRGL